MTRINIGVPVEELTKKHLIAEHREIKRIPNAIRKGRYDLKNQPKQFKLGEGHVKFFYDKILYLKKRYEQLYAECISRNINVTYFGESFNDIPQHLMNDYVPNDNDIKLIKQRIYERLNS